jgi:Flp pilus assembly protein TadG
MKLHTRFVQEESGQALLESAVFICIMFVLVVFAINFNFYINSINMIHSSSARGADFSTQGDLTAFGTLPSATTVTTAVKNEAANTTHFGIDVDPSITVCSPAGGSSAGCSGFTDPEASTANTGNFVTNSVQVTETFTPFFGSGKSVLGFNLIPFSSRSTVSHTVFMRALN